MGLSSKVGLDVSKSFKKYGPKPSGMEGLHVADPN